MNFRSYTSEGIILAKKAYGEADKILVVYSKSRGKQSLIAKGIRKPKSRKRGHIEVFNKIIFQATKGHGLDVMTEAEVIDDFKEIKKSLKKISLAYYFMEVIGKITHEGENNNQIFSLIDNYLKALKTSRELKKLRLSFVTELLEILGYWPRGRKLDNPDEKLEEVIERDLVSSRVGKILST